MVAARHQVDLAEVGRQGPRSGDDRLGARGVPGHVQGLREQECVRDPLGALQDREEALQVPDGRLVGVCAPGGVGGPRQVGALPSVVVAQPEVMGEQVEPWSIASGSADSSHRPTRPWSIVRRANGRLS